MNRTFLTLSFSWLLEYVSSSMSESPQSECSDTLGASNSFAFLVLGGRAGGVGSEPWLESGLWCWALDRAVEAAEALSRYCWTPLAGGWLSLGAALPLEVWEVRLACCCTGDEAEEGEPALWRGGLGLAVPACSSDEVSKSSSRLWPESSTFRGVLAWKGRWPEEDSGKDEEVEEQRCQSTSLETIRMEHKVGLVYLCRASLWAGTPPE